MGGRLRGMPSFVKPWTNGGASQCKFLTCVQLAFHLATPLHWLALTLVALKFVRKFFVFLGGHPMHVDTSWLQDNWICMKFTTFCNLCELATRLANPFGHPLQVHKQVLVWQTCTDLHRLVSSFGQDIKEWKWNSSTFLRCWPVLQANYLDHNDIHMKPVQIKLIYY